MSYQPNYDTTIDTTTRTIVERHTTRHVDYIDPAFPLDTIVDPSRVASISDWLKICSDYKDRVVYASDDGGCPKITKRVVGVGMVSQSPYWTPRPSVQIESWYGYKWIDAASLTFAGYREENWYTVRHSSSGYEFTCEKCRKTHHTPSSDGFHPPLACWSCGHTGTKDQLTK